MMRSPHILLLLFIPAALSYSNQSQPEYYPADENESSVVCELPPFTNQLPLEYRRELRKIWTGLAIGARRCERQLTLTKQLIDRLPEAIRLSLLESALGIPEDDRSPTPFLTRVSTNQRVLFAKIVSNRSISESERLSMLREWADEWLDMDAMTQFEQYVGFLENKARRQMEKIKQLSPEARLAFDRIEAIRREKQAIFNNLSEDARRELAILWRPRCPRRGRQKNLPPGGDLDGEEVQLACSSSALRWKPTAIRHKTTSPPAVIHITPLPIATTEPTTPQTSTWDFWQTDEPKTEGQREGEKMVKVFEVPGDEVLARSTTPKASMDPSRTVETRKFNIYPPLSEDPLGIAELLKKLFPVKKSENRNDSNTSTELNESVWSLQ